MRYFSTRDPSYFVSPSEAIVANLCPLGGLFQPESIAPNPALLTDKNLSLYDLAFTIAKTFLSPCFTDKELLKICKKAFDFNAPILQLSATLSIMELTHGPSLAFKDFGARFMAQCLSLIAQKKQQAYTVLTATSGDTGAAVAAALHAQPGVEVSILFPEGRISAFQQNQMTKWKANIRTIAVRGSFDDCQRLVKEAFREQSLSARLNLVSANSINIARLIAQMVYYIKLLQHFPDPNALRIIVPSGNLGNLTAGLFAAYLCRCTPFFIAAHNANSTFADYLRTGTFEPKSSVTTISNAMDVGAPSNFERIESLFSYGERNNDLCLKALRSQLSAAVVGDEQTLSEMRHLYQQYTYLACPHTAVGTFVAREQTQPCVVLSTAHPIKFAGALALAKLPVSFGLDGASAQGADHSIDPTSQALFSLL